MLNYIQQQIKQTKSPSIQLGGIGKNDKQTKIQVFRKCQLGNGALLSISHSCYLKFVLCLFKLMTWSMLIFAHYWTPSICHDDYHTIMFIKNYIYIVLLNRKTFYVDLMKFQYKIILFITQQILVKVQFYVSCIIQDHEVCILLGWEVKQEMD